MNKVLLIISLLVLGIFHQSFAQIIYPPAIQCVENNGANGNITLNWTDPAPNPCGAFVQYTIYASSHGPGGPYDSVIAVTSQAATSITLANYNSGTTTWYFYMQANYNCPSGTVLNSDTVNNLNPAVPQIVNVTVTPGGQVIFNWLPGASPQTYAYVCYYYLSNGTGVPFDTVYGRNNTTTTDILGNPNIQSLVYTVAAMDSCGKISSFNTSPHNTIYTTAQVVTCQQQMNIAWNKYINWPQGVDRYELWVSKFPGPFVLQGTTDSATLSYSYTNFNDGDSITLFIRAISKADTTIISNGNLVVIKARIVQPPSYNYITNLTVDAFNHVEITWTIDTIAQLIFYKLMRGADTLSYTPADQIPVPVPLKHFQTYIDSNYVAPQNNPYFYKVVAVDSCENIYPSPFGETVNLKGNEYDVFSNQLMWNDFVLQYATVMKYNLYRDIGNGYQLIRTFLPGTNLFFDSVQQFLATAGSFCYKIEAVYSISLPAPSGYQDTLSSFSNVVCISERPVIYIPNAFAPSGVNNIFKPTIIFGGATGYTMTIFNRWGGKVFETTNPNDGWDGTDHGKESTMGGYAYLIQFYAGDGTAIERKGIVLLVR
ncbi:MAG: hypothetical protein JWO06_131 [Bacteroidota bacterium]|nr:hypothetical protein [Bacteroidota bacterium]